MDMDIVDVVHADKVEEGDFIIFDGSICEVKEITDDSEGILFISDDDRERLEQPFDSVEIFGYSSD